MFVIAHGAVSVHDGESVIAVLGEREIVGEMAVLSSETRSATVTAIKDTLLLRITQEALEELMWGHREVARRLILILVQRLRNLTS